MSADQNNLNKNSFMAKVGNFFRKAWPINWNNFKNFKLIQQVLVAAPYPFKTTLLIFTTIILVSLGFFGFGTYLVLTKEVPGSGGLIREAVITNDVKIFNPVLELNSPMERKVSQLVFHPLYSITYPDLSVASAEPIIKPILLSKSPEWQDLNDIKPENRYKRLRFTIKNNLKWSNNTSITTSDIEYTFESLKQDTGNSIFRSAFAGITFESISTTEFNLVAQTSTPKLLYSANFSPISKTFFEGISTERMLTDPRSFKPTVTSGHFTFSSGITKDPDTGSNRDNPFRDSSTGLIEAVLLDRNNFQNTGESILVEQYYIQKVANLFDTGGNSQSVERLSKSGRLDIFQRNLATDLGVSSSDVSSKLRMNQTILPSNTFYSLYLNIKLDNNTGYFINQFLRKYVICNFLNYQLDQRYSSQLDNIPADRRLVPIIFGESVESGCPENVDTVLEDLKSSSGQNVYTIKFDPTTGIKRVLLFGEEFRINLVGPPNTEPLLSDIQAFFLSIGVPANLISDPDQVANSLQTKTYNAAFLPVTYTSQDPYPLFGISGQDILQASKNNRILSYKLEENLRKYSDSNLTDQVARQSLIDFFKKEYVAVNLFRSKQEINYTSKIVNIESQLPALLTFNEEIYSKTPAWYVSTKRQFWFE